MRKLVLNMQVPASSLSKFDGDKEPQDNFSNNIQGEFYALTLGLVDNFKCKGDFLFKHRWSEFWDSLRENPDAQGFKSIL